MGLYINKVTNELVDIGNYLGVPNTDVFIKVPEDTVKITKDSGRTITFWNKDGWSMNDCDIDLGWANPLYDDVMTFEEYSEYSYELLHDFELKSNEVVNEEPKPQNKKVKSDGGSSSYYFTKLPQHLIDQIVETGGIEIKDIVRYCFDNDADCKDIIKALKRIREDLKGGGKEGSDAMYNARKVVYFADELFKHIENDYKQ